MWGSLLSLGGTLASGLGGGGGADATSMPDTVTSSAEGRTGGATLRVGGGPDPWFWLAAAVFALLLFKSK